MFTNEKMQDDRRYYLITQASMCEPGAFSDQSWKAYSVSVVDDFGDLVEVSL